MKQQLPSVLPSTKRLSILHVGEKQISPYTLFNGAVIDTLEMEEHFQSYVLEELKATNFHENLSSNTIIIVDYDEITKKYSPLFNFITKTKQFSEYPVIAYINQGSKVVSNLALKKGIVDIIELPITGEELKAKLFFWSKYGKKIKHHKTYSVIAAPLIISPAKRMFDIVGASLLIAMLSPIMLLIALAIKIDSRGSIVYKSTRIGAGYKKFQFLKFRSMYQNADEKLKQLIHLNQYDAERSGEKCFIKIKNDPRVTRVGRIIRKTSLDELPQLFNVLRGEMSLVGNRPLPVYEAELMVRDVWATRFMAPAGLTGLWQITKRAKKDMSTEERVELDVLYAKNHSFWYDMGILLKTIPAMIQEEDV